MVEPASDPYLIAWTRLAARCSASQFEEALVLVRQMRQDFPASAAALSHAQAGLLVRAGDAAAGLPVMRSLLPEGRWWSRHQLADPDLAPLSLLPGYRETASVMARRADSALEAARATRPRVFVATPSTALRGTVVVLPMRGISGHETASIWEPVTSTGIAVVTVESSLSNGDHLPCWDHPGLAERDVHEAVALARALGAPIVVAGGSQGAGVAATLALGGAITDLAGVICVVGAPAAGTCTINTPLPTLLIAGDDDPCTMNRQQEFRNNLTAAGHDVQYLEIPHLPHTYPPDWATLAPPLIERLLTSSAS